MRMRSSWIGLSLLLTATVASADVIQDWSDVTLDAIRAERTNPPRASRGLAMVHVAMFDAVNAVRGEYEPYLTQDFKAPQGASLEAAAATAAWTVLGALYPQQAEVFDAALAESLAAIPDGKSKSDGIALGGAVGAAMLAARANDGSENAGAYTVGNEPGDWQPTPPAFAPALLPNWGNVLPFCLNDVREVRRAGPPALTSAEYTTAFNEVKTLGSKGSTVRTEEQSLIALFWVDGPGTATPPGHWYQIARDVSQQRGSTLIERARLYALLGMAVCDAAICSWDNKYIYNDWRPVTGIRNADTDGNPDTSADPDWEPFIPTPPFPAYTSGHSTFSGAGGKILALFYGSDEIPFVTTSDDYPGTARSFQRFSQAANEAGRSRIYGGIHWEYDNQDGLATGRELAVDIYANFLRPKQPGILQIRAEDVLPCGPFGLIPLGLTLAALSAWRGVRLRPQRFRR